MKVSRPTRRQLIVVLAAIVIIALGQAGSSAYQRYSVLQRTAEDYTLSEGVCRQRASVCEALSLNLREVAALAREVAKSASSDFERSKWLKMANSEEEKAAKLEHESVQAAVGADRYATRANIFYHAAWRPWLGEPE